MATALAPAVPENFTFASNVEEKVYRDLLDLGAAPAVFFRDACYLKSLTSPMPVTTTHLVMHLLREVNGFLIDVAGPLGDENLYDNSDVDGGRLKAAIKYLGLKEEDVLAKEWKKLKDSLHGRAHRSDLMSPRIRTEEFEQLFVHAIKVMASVLGYYRKRFLKVIEYVDSAILRNDPPSDIGKRLPATRLVHSYFFANLNNPRWLKPLKKKGFFSIGLRGKYKVATGESDEYWPQSQYLKRMSAVPDRNVQQQVLAIMLGAGAVQSCRVHADFAEAVTVMPVDLAAKWASREVEWLKEGYVIYGSLETNLGKLISKLAKEGEARVALKLAAELLSISPDPEEATKRALTDEMEIVVRGSLVPVTRCDRYTYEQVLTKHITDLAVSEPFGTLDLLCSLLERAVFYSQRDGEEHKPHDATFIWRPAIEDNDQNRDHKIDCPLITAIRDAAEGICERQPDSIEQVVLTFEKHGWNVFRRIGMHILRVAKDAPKELIEKRLVNQELLLDTHCHHEYYHLLKEKFGCLSPEKQQVILGLIEQGQNLEKREDLTPERKVQRKEQWQRRILSAIKDDLPEAWKVRYRELEAKTGEPCMPPDFNAYSSGGVWKGPQSPRTAEDVALMSNDELISLLKTWQPSSDWMSPTPDGLGMVLGEVVQKQPEKFVGELAKFMDPMIGPTYIRHIISGFCRVLEGGGQVAYDPVYKFLNWVLQQQEDCSGRTWPADYKDGIDVDKKWSYAYGEVLRFIDKSLSNDTGLPLSLRNQVWKLILPLTDDPEPRPEDEAKRIHDNMDPLTVSINSIRGKALHATMQYAMWVYRHIQDEVKSQENRTPNFKDMLEVVEVLEKHLDPAIDSTRTSRAVYGQWMAQMVHLGPDWVKANMGGRLFPAEPGKKLLREAVWNTYLIYGGQLHGNVVKILRDVYREEIVALSGYQGGEKSYESPAMRLAEHAVIIYLWDEYDKPDDSLVGLVFKVAPPVIKTHIMEFIGRDVWRNDTVEPEIIERMKGLWEWRVAKVGGYEGMAEEELATFGWWFASGKFEPVWALRNLEQTLTRTNINASNLQAMEQLSDLYESHPGAVLRCLQLFVHVNSDPWFFVSSSKQKGVWTILERGMGSNNDVIRDQAEEIVHLLGSKGHLEFRELLRGSRSRDVSK